MAKTVTGNVELGFHLCYGTNLNRLPLFADLLQVMLVKNTLYNFRNTEMVVDVALALIDATSRPIPITCFYIPVPKGRDDDAYF